MKIAIVSRENLRNKKYWSGVIANIFFQLKKVENIEIIEIDNLNNIYRKMHALKREYIRLISNSKYDEAYNIKVSKNFANQINNKLKSFKEINYILAFDKSLIAYLKTDIPIILWTDILYSDYYEHYYSKHKISKKTKNEIKIIEKKAINNSYKIILTSNWALNKAKKKYHYSKKKFFLIEFGSNLKSNLNKKKIINIINKRSKYKLNLTTIGVNWKRKGLDNAIKLTQILNKSGVNTYLNIIGLKNEKQVNDKKILFSGFIDKNKKDGEKKIANYLKKSHFHLLFSESEAYGISLIEANSLAVPNIIYNVGGMSHIVKNNISGLVFRKDSKLNYIAIQIKKILFNKSLYKKLSLSSYIRFKKKFDYNVIINKFIKLLDK